MITPTEGWYISHKKNKRKNSGLSIFSNELIHYVLLFSIVIDFVIIVLLYNFNLKKIKFMIYLQAIILYIINYIMKSNI